MYMYIHFAIYNNFTQFNSKDTHKNFSYMYIVLDQSS